MNRLNIVLASASPRRIEMLKKHGYDPVIFPSDIEENTPLYDGGRQTCEFLALKKALNVEGKLDEKLKNSHPYIIAADTVVYKDKVIGKPCDRKDAEDILMSLEGSSHQVITGVAIIKAGTEKRTVFSCTTDVFFRSYRLEDLDEYLSGDEPYDKAGAYAIQGYFGRYIEKYDGSLNNVIGFPLEEILAEIEAMIND